MRIIIKIETTAKKNPLFLELTTLIDEYEHHLRNLDMIVKLSCEFQNKFEQFANVYI